MTRLELPRRRNEWPERQLPGSSPEKPGRGRCELRITPPGWSVAQRSRGVQSRCPPRQLRSRQFAPSPQPGLESSTSRTSDVRTPLPVAGRRVSHASSACSNNSPRVIPCVRARRRKRSHASSLILTLSCCLRGGTMLVAPPGRSFDEGGGFTAEGTRRCPRS